MPIQEQNIKIAKSSVMLDVPEGGGPPSASYVVDGVSNQIFDDISEVARAGGNVSIRKVHTVVQTDDTSVFLGANVIVAEPPEDPRVGVSLFSTRSTFDTREEAAKRIESYLFAGPVWNGYLFENHITGQRTVQYFQYPNSVLPKAGTTMYLIKDETLATEYGQYIRVIDVSFEERTFINEDDGKPYQAWVVACELSDPLSYDFPGSPPSAKFKMKEGKTLTRETRVTDAAKYYGVSKLATAATMGDTKVRAASVYTPIVPSAQTEIPLVNQSLQNTVSPMVQASITTVTWSFPYSGDAYPQSRWLPCGCKPGSFTLQGNQVFTDDGMGNVVDPTENIVGSINYATGQVTFPDSWHSATDNAVTFIPAAEVAQQTFTLFRNVTQETRRFNWIETLKPKPAPGTLSLAYMALGNWYVLRDNGIGELRGDDSSYGSGTINYVTGTMAATTGVLPDADTGIFLVWATAGLYQMTDTATATPPVWRFTIPITAGYTVEKGTVSVSWTVNGVVKSLTDAAKPGVLQGGDAGYGAVQYFKGNIAFNMAKLPDPASTPLVAYSRSLKQTQTFTPTKDANGFINITLPNVPIKPRSVAIEWETIRSKTFSERSNNALGGTATYTAREAYNAASTTSSMFQPHTGYWRAESTHSYSAGLSESAQVEVSASASYTVRSERSQDGSESNVVTSKTAFDYQPDPLINEGEIFGTQKGEVNYDTGVLRFMPTEIMRTSSWGLTTGGSFATSQSQSQSEEDSAYWAGSTHYSHPYYGDSKSAGVTTNSSSSSSVSSGGASDASNGAFGSESFSDTWGDGSAVKVSWVEAAILPQIQNATIPAQPLVFDLSPYTGQQVVPRSVMFKLGTATYVDRDGVLYMSVNPMNGSGVEAGFINYGTGTVTINLWNAGDDPDFDVISCLTRHGNFFTSSVAFRTGAAPLKSSSVQVIATTVSGEQFIGTSNLDGWILHTEMIGKVNYRSGIVQVAFGGFMPQPDWVPSVPPVPGETAPMVWGAIPMEASTIRYNAVAYSYLPLDAVILGLNPVRLPADGMVPMFRKGEFAVVGNTQTTASMTVTVGQAVNLGRTRLSRIRVLHDFSVSNPHGTPISVGYGVNLNSGIVTFNDPGTYIQPIKIEHRIEDMAMVSDVQINGVLTFTRPVTHDYPAETSYVSAAIVAGDLRARVSAVFDQETWTSDQWDDNRVGAGASASFNNAIFPILVTNAGAVSERWVIRFLTTTSFEVIGEHVGNIFVGNTNPAGSETHLDIPNAAVPGQNYMQIPYLGFGSGWSAGNILRINTVGAQFPLWVIRTVQQGPETAVDDTFSILVRGDVDTVI